MFQEGGVYCSGESSGLEQLDSLELEESIENKIEAFTIVIINFREVYKKWNHMVDQK